MNTQLIQILMDSLQSSPNCNILDWREDGNKILIRYENSDGMVMIGEISFSELGYAAVDARSDFRVATI